MGKAKLNSTVPKRDLCQTPPYALDPLIPYLKPEWTVWECASGEGKLTWALQKYVKFVFDTDIIKGVNFLTCVPPLGYYSIITNPPFSLKYKFLERCYEWGKPFALLMPVDTLGAKKAQVLFDKFGVEVIFISPRINFCMPGKRYSGKGAQFSTAWFTYKFNIGRQMTFVHLEPREDETENGQSTT